MAFFRNRAVNLLNLHYGIHSIALSGGAAFFVIYLLNSGVPIPGVLGSLALILMARFVIRPIVIGFAARWGLRVMVVAGTMLSALQYPILVEVDGAGLALAALIVAAAVGDAVYWTTYHAYFGALGDDRLRGQQIGVREAIATVVGIASPLLTGWMLVTFGPRVAFGTTSVIVALAAACFAAAQAAGGSGFIACFVGGLLLSGLGEGHKKELLRGAEHTGEALALLTWVVFGGIVVARLIDRVTWPALLYAVLSLTVVRMLPVFLCLIGTRTSTADRLFIGWFGPRGLATIVFAVLVLDEKLPGNDTIMLAAGWTVLLSVVAHGMTANPLVKAIGGRPEAGSISR